MSLIATLNKPVQEPEFATVLKAFPRPNVANHLGITTQYLDMLIHGRRRPGRNLEERMIELAQKVKSEMAQA